ncbi:MAG TPA: hypothetical protein VLH86_03845 [Patescibacteria group bacterium]|nr:hypothetical protein [Patescibacteria group bacterium]
MASEESAAENAPRQVKKYWIIGGLAAGLLLILILLFILHPWKRDNSVLPSNITTQIKTFTPYQPELLPNGLHVEKSSVTFDGNLLTFRLSKPGASMVITEQLSPPGLANRSYPSEKVEGVDGTGYISHDKTRTFATLFATGRDNKPTMVLINTGDPFTSDDFKDLLRSFRIVQ